MSYCPVKKSHYNRKARYNLTPAGYANLLAKQRGCCAICKRAIRLAVDHEHSSKKVRGLLCNGCNLMLGYARDNISILKAGIRYLRNAA